MDPRETDLSPDINLETYATLGRMTAGIAHEIVNPVTFARNNVLTLRSYIDSLEEVIELIEQCASDDDNADANTRRLRQLTEEIEVQALLDELRDVTNETLEGIQEIAALVTTVRQYAGRPHTHCVDANIDETLCSIVRVTRNEHKYKCTISLDLNCESPVRAKQHELNFVLVALLLRVVEAIEKDASLCIRTQSDESDMSDQDSVVVDLVNSDWIDSGRTISIRNERLNADRQLSLVAELVSQHGGTLLACRGGDQLQGYRLLYPITRS